MARFFRRLAWAFCIVVAAALRFAPAAAEPVVTGVSIAEQAGATRLVLELSERANFQIFLLNEPMRLVLDLPPVNWRLGSQEKAAGVVAGYRYGQFDSDTARLVLDLATPARVRRSGYELQPKLRSHRLVLDLVPVTAEAFAAEVQPWTSSGAGLETAQPSPPAPLAAPPPARPVTVASVPAIGAVRPARRADAKRIVVLDAGHGGVDPGTIGVNGTYEKDVTLAVTREIRRQLLATGRYVVVMTREDDMFVQLRERVAKARAIDADLFLSIHADSIASANTRGASIYTLSETASDEEAAALAARENRADIIAGVDLSTENKDVASILIDLAQRETMNRSAALAATLADELSRDILMLPNRPHRFAGFAVLKAPDIPSALIELGYLSNRKDAKLLGQADHRRKIAASLVRAIDAFFARKGRS